METGKQCVSGRYVSTSDNLHSPQTHRRTDAQISDPVTRNPLFLLSLKPEP